MLSVLGHSAFNLLASTGSVAELFATPFSNSVLVFATLMLILFVVPLICRPLRIPEMIGLIAAGIAIGPLAFNILPRDGAVELMGKVGLLYIMFTAGLEIDLNGFLKYRNRSLVFGGLTFVLPMILGSAAVYFLLQNDLPHDNMWPATLLLASCFASHTLLSYPIASRLGLSQNPAVTTALGGTIITDTLALLVLAVIAATTQGDVSTAFWIKLVGSMVAYTAFVLLVIPRISRWFFRNLESDGPMQYVYVLTVVFVCGVLAMVAGMEDIIGAFFAGLAINRLIPHRSSLMNRIDFVGNALFIPIFLISVGMVVNPRSLVEDINVWAVASVIVGSVVVTKFLAAFATKAVFGYSKDEGFVIFGLSVAQAAATLAAVFVGMEIGLFNEAILNGVIILILVTCVISPIVTERYGRNVARKEEAESATAGEAPQRLLIPLANPATTESLMNIAVLLHDPKSTEPLYPLTVAMDGDGVEDRVAQGEKNLDSAIALAASANRPVSPVTRVDINVADGIIRALVELRIRTVLIGWNGQVSPEQRIFGSILDRLLDGSDQTLFVYRHARPTIEHKRVVLAIPPFATRQAGFSTAMSEISTLCQQLGVQLHVMTPRDGKQAVQKQFSRAKPSISAQWIDLTTWDWLLSELQQNAQPEDLIILMAARKGSIAWGPELDKLPRQLAQRFTSNSFMIVYPQTEADAVDITTDPHRTGALRRFIQNGGRPIDLNVFDDTAAIQEITQRLPISVSGTNVEALLQKSAGSSSIRIAPGTVLIDAHDPNISLSSLIVAKNPDEAITFRNLAEPVHNIFVLLTGSDVTEAQHMQLLTTVSMKLRQASVTDIRGLSSTEDTIHLLDA